MVTWSGSPKVTFRPGSRQRKLRSTSSRARRKEAVVFLAGATLLLLLLVGAASALADEAGSPAAPVRLSEYGPELLKDAGTAALKPATDGEAAEKLPHRDLGREEAQELLTSVFSEQLEAPAGIFDDLEVEKFYTDHVAVIPAGEEPSIPSGEADGQEPGLLDSLLPLRAEDAAGQKAVVDLDLKHAEGELQPANPLVDVGIPSELGEGISLPEVGVEINLPDAPAERSPSTVEEKSTAFFPNVATDSDLTVAPTPTGVETLTQLRSPDAPRGQTFELTLPSGAALKPSAGGGAEVVRGDEPLVMIPTPTALDAKGSPVGVSLEVSGNSLTVEAKPDADAAYPILVDPIYQAYQWASLNDPGFGDWRSSTGNPRFWATQMGIWGGQYGLNLKTEYAAVPPYSAASWDTFVPRYFSDYENSEVKERPTSYIKNLTFNQLYFWIEENQPYHVHPFFMVALSADKTGQFIAAGSHNSAEGQYLNPSGPYVLINPNENVEAKHGGIALASYESIAYPRHVYVAQASVELSDKEAPSFALVGGAGQWVNDKPSSPINYKATDPGLGISYLAEWQRLEGSSNFRRVISGSGGCVGTFSNACLRSWSSAAGNPALNYEPQLMPQGETWISLEACDPIGHCSPENGATEIKIKVDHTAPGLTLSGTMTEQASLGTQKAQYTVKAAATDGTEAQPRSGVAKIEIKIDGKPISLDSSWSPGCATKNCGLTKEWTLNADQYSAGQHKVEVIATDGVGLSTTKSVTIETHPDLTAPAVALSGSMTEQASLGTTRPSYLLKVNASDPGGAEERKSGVASTSVKVDGISVDAYSPGCSAGGCSITREWTLNSNSYAVGTHAVQITATDAAGKSTSKSLTINIARDETAPQLSAPNAFYTAPEGWLEQQSYDYNATASDPDGYGITSLLLRIDGAVIKSVTQSCPQGGCAISFGAITINMASYGGGEHPAELIATDGAGNVKKKSWAIRVDPKGTISTGEAEDTLEAMEDTTELNVVGPAKAEEVEGTAPGLMFEVGESELIVAGSLAPTTLDPGSEGTLTVEIPTEADLSTCEGTRAGAEEDLSEAQEQQILEATKGCEPSASPESALVPVEVRRPI